MSDGKALRERVSRTSHAKWAALSGHPDPIEVLQHSDRGRLPEHLPIRYGRMRKSPFAFFRGSAAVMAWDLSKSGTRPGSGISHGISKGLSDQSSIPPFGEQHYRTSKRKSYACSPTAGRHRALRLGLFGSRSLYLRGTVYLQLATERMRRLSSKKFSLTEGVLQVVGPILWPAQALPERWRCREIQRVTASPIRIS